MSERKDYEVAPEVWQAETDREPEQPPFTRKEKRMITFAALKASLLIGLVYLAGIAAVIGLLYVIWAIC